MAVALMEPLVIVEHGSAWTNPLVIAAGVAAVASIVVALISQWGTRRRIGKDNGHGSVQDHLDCIRHTVEQIDSKVDAHVGDDEAHWYPD